MYKTSNKDLLHNPGNYTVINYNGKELIERVNNISKKLKARFAKDKCEIIKN